ncbi:RNA polymerase sigma factor [Planctomycetota bacterium]
MRLIRAGDADAMKVIVTRYHQRVIAYASGMIQNEEEARDIAQDCFVYLLNNCKDYKPGGNLLTWLLTIARFRVLKAMRGRSMQITLSAKLQQELRSQAAALTGMQEPSLSLEHAEIRRLVRAAIRTLSPQVQEILHLRFTQGLSYKEMAILLKQTPGALKNHVYLAKEKLGKMLKNL